MSRKLDSGISYTQHHQTRWAEPDSFAPTTSQPTGRKRRAGGRSAVRWIPDGAVHWLDNQWGIPHKHALFYQTDQIARRLVPGISVTAPIRRSTPWAFIRKNFPFVPIIEMSTLFAFPSKNQLNAQGTVTENPGSDVVEGHYGRPPNDGYPGVANSGRLQEVNSQRELHTPSRQLEDAVVHCNNTLQIIARSSDSIGRDLFSAYETVGIYVDASSQIFREV